MNERKREERERKINEWIFIIFLDGGEKWWGEGKQGKDKLFLIKIYIKLFAVP
jgi:hypothetical protein